MSECTQHGRMCQIAKLEGWTQAICDDLEASRPRRGGAFVPTGEGIEQQRWERLYGEKCIAVEEVADPVAERTWPDYVPGRGPRPFTSNTQREEYCRRYGFQHH